MDPGNRRPQHDGLGDRTFYFLAALQAVFVSFRVKHHCWGEDQRRNRAFWLLLVLMLLSLGVNKQLDLQSYYTAVAKCSAQLGGWYEERRQLQLLFIVSIGSLFTFAALFPLWYFRGNLSHNWWAIIGTSFLMAFVLIRASSFHHLDIALNYLIGDVRMNWILELSGIMLISVQCMINFSREKMVTVDIDYARAT